MNKITKKVLSCILAVVMISILLPTAIVLADDTKTVDASGELAPISGSETSASKWTITPSWATEPVNGSGGVLKLTLVPTANYVDVTFGDALPGSATYEKSITVDQGTETYSITYNEILFGEVMSPVTVTGDVKWPEGEPQTTGNLTIGKTVSGDGASSTDSFTFNLSIRNDNGPIPDGTYGDMTFSDGKTVFTLSDGQTKTATGIPDGMTYIVSEDYSFGYTSSVTEGDQLGNITAGKTVTVMFNNDKPDTTVSDIKNDYKPTADLTDTDKEDEEQKNYQEAEGSTDNTYLYKTAEWIDKDTGKARITLTAESERPSSKTSAVYVINTCTVHGFTKETAAENLGYLLKNYGTVDVLFVSFNEDSAGNGIDGTDYIKTFSDVSDTTCLDQVTWGPSRHAASDVASALETYLFGSHGSTTQVKFPTAIFASFDNDIGYDMSSLAKPETDAFWNLLAEYDKNGKYFSMGSCDRSEDDLADTSGRIADPYGYTTGTLPEFTAKNVILNCAVRLNHVAGLVESSEYKVDKLGTSGTIDGLTVNGLAVTPVSSEKMNGTTAIKPTLTASATGTYGGKYNVDLTATNVAADIEEDFLLPNTITVSYGYYAYSGSTLSSLYYQTKSVKINGNEIDLTANPSIYVINDVNENDEYKIEIVGERKSGLYHGATDFLYSDSIEDAIESGAIVIPKDVTISDTVSDKFNILNVSTSDDSMTTVQDGNSVTSTYSSYPGDKVIQVYIDIELKDLDDAENIGKWLSTNSEDATYEFEEETLTVDSPLLCYKAEKAPETTTTAPETTTTAPETTTTVPETTTTAPETTTTAPETTTTAPETTTTAPETTTTVAETTTTVPETTTAPETTTVPETTVKPPETPGGSSETTTKPSEVTTSSDTMTMVPDTTTETANGQYMENASDTTGNSGDSSTPGTGENSMVFVWIIVAIASVAILCICLGYSKKKKI